MTNLPTSQGSWVACINPFQNPVKHSFFRYIPKDPRFHENDKAKICPLCWDEAQRRNGTLKRAPRADNPKNANIMAKPTPEYL